MHIKRSSPCSSYLAGALVAPEFIGCLLVNAIEQEIKRLDAINSKLSTFTLNLSGQLQPAAQGKIKFGQGS